MKTAWNKKYKYPDSSINFGQNEGLPVKPTDLLPSYLFNNIRWELNKLYHLVVLACAYDYTKEDEHGAEIPENLDGDIEIKDLSLSLIHIYIGYKAVSANEYY